MLPNNQWVIEEIKRYLKTHENENINIKNCGMDKNCSKKEVYSDKSLTQETEKSLTV